MKTNMDNAQILMFGQFPNFASLAVYEKCNPGKKFPGKMFIKCIVFPAEKEKALFSSFPSQSGNPVFSY